MKKLCLFSILSIFAIGGLQAQGNLEASAEVGIVIGDASDFTSLSLGVALAYLFEVSDDFQAGPSIGYTNYFGKDLDVGNITFKTDDFGVVPILAKGQYAVSDEFEAEGGVGYAVFTGDGGGGELTWRLGINYEFADAWDAAAGYNSITGNGGSIDAFFVGVRRTF